MSAPPLVLLKSLERSAIHEHRCLRYVRASFGGPDKTFFFRLRRYRRALDMRNAARLSVLAVIRVAVVGVLAFATGRIVSQVAGLVVADLSVAGGQPLTRYPFLDDGDATRADLERDECACVVCGQPTWSVRV